MVLPVSQAEKAGTAAEAIISSCPQNCQGVEKAVYASQTPIHDAYVPDLLWACMTADSAAVSGDLRFLMVGML